MLGTTASRSNLINAGAAALLLSSAAACGQSDAASDPDAANLNDGGKRADARSVADGRTAGDGNVLADRRSSADGSDTRDQGTSPVTPTVVSIVPPSGGTAVPLNTNIAATFNVPMNGASLATSFTVAAKAVAVPGTVTYANGTAVFTPSALLASNTLCTATVATGAASALGVALAAPYSWTFTTGIAAATGLPVNLGTASKYVILAKTGVSTVPISAITGDIAVSPAAASYITGFSLTENSTDVFSTSMQVTGNIYAADYKAPTPSNLTTAVSDMQTAFTDAASRAPTVTELGAGNIGGLTLDAGVYKWGTGLLIPTDVTLTGSATDVWIFQIAKGLTMSSGAKVLMSGGALPENVFWQVSGAVSLGTTSHCEGVVLGQTDITLESGASVHGRLLAQTAITLAGNTIVAPSP